MPAVAQRTLVALLVGAALLGGALGAVITSIVDTDNATRASSVTTTSRAKPVPLPTTPRSTTPRSTTPFSIPPTSTAGGPPCTSAAVLQAIQASGINAVSVAGVQCGNGWAGASYETAQIAGASLLKVQGAHWVVTDRGQSCNDPTIPPAVHFYCTVS
jgi:hypothetical protein